MQEDQKLVQQGEIRALTHLSSHTELLLAPNRKELTLLHRLATPLKWTASSSETIYIIGNKLGQTKTSGAGAKEQTHHFPRRLNSASQGRPRGPILPIVIEGPSRGS